MPELAVDPADTSDEALGLDGAQDVAGLRIDLVDLAAVMLADPKRAFGPGKAGIAALAGGRDGCEDAAVPISDTRPAGPQST